jgi:hypothetical protein
MKVNLEGKLSKPAFLSRDCVTEAHVGFRLRTGGIVPDARSSAIGKCRNCAALENLDGSCLADKL